MESSWMTMMWLLLMFLWLSVTLETVRSDSFYGTSYVHLPFPQDENAAEIQLQFRTSRTRGLLISAFNQDNACTIRLRESKVEAVFKHGDAKFTLQSRRKPRLNNLRWHHVRVTLGDGQVALYVDGDEKDSHSTSQETFTFRNINVGGTGDIDSDHLSSDNKYFRGCLEDITVGNINVFDASRTAEGAIQHDTTPDCSLEFEAGIDDPFSFVKETAFVLYPRWHIQHVGSFACWVRTSASVGLLMFMYRGGDFIAAEVKDGHLRVLLKIASGETVTVESQRLINDRTWHFVKIGIASSDIRISVDYNPEIFTLSDPLPESFEFTGALYVGGVVQHARNLAYNSDLHSITHASTGGSFRGCVRDVEVDGVQFTLGDSHITHGIQVGCLYEFPCSLEPCGSNERCIETGPSDYRCDCQGEGCLELTSTVLSTTSVATIAPTTTARPSTSLATTTQVTPTSHFMLFTVKPLSVVEGAGTRIASTNIQLNLNLGDYRVRQSQLLFRIDQPPQFGHINNDVLGTDELSDQFTYLDLMTGKISYVHDSSENFEDLVGFVVTLSGKKNQVIPELSEEVNLTLPIIITSVNDPPAIVIADDGTFRMITDTTRVLHSAFIHADDPDTPPPQLIFTIVSQQGNVGYFEHSQNSGETITEFTQQDIENDHIGYVHTGPSLKSRIVIRASDGRAKSSLASFRIEVAPLSLEVQNLTAVRLNPATAQVILPENLGVVTNDPDDAFQVSYLVSTPPRLGEVQVLDSSGQWIGAAEFNQHHIKNGQVRYVASRATGDSEVTYDQIGIVASSSTATTPNIFVPVEIVVTSVRLVVNTGLVLNVVSKAFLTGRNLSAEASHVLNDAPITYQIVRTPTRGDIIKHLVGALDAGANFTQEDIAVGLVSYQLKRNYDESFNDTLVFRVVVSTAQTESHEFVISYFPDTAKLIVTNNGLSVLEGGKHMLETSDLFLETAATTDFLYTVTSAPMHGVLQLRDPSSSNILTPNVTIFLNMDITRGALHYVHDDSETVHDSFEFRAMATYLDRLGHGKRVNHSSIVNVTIELQNDNRPVRAVNKVFNVIKGGKTLLTTDDLMYTDADTDYDDNNLLYRRQRIIGGDLVRTDDQAESVYQFRQRDLSAGRILFKHEGDNERSRLLYYVFDEGRKHNSVGLLQIMAIESYVNISVNTGVHIARGEAAVITSANLSADSNIDVKARRIEYLITSEPQYGSIMAGGVTIRQFTQESLDNSAVIYQHHNSSNSVSDSFNFTVTTRGLEAYGQFNIRIFVTSKKELPSVEKLQPLVVEAGEEVVLNKLYLKVSHPNHPASEIVYKVISPPKYGELRLKNEFGIIISRSPPLPRRRRSTDDTAMRFTQQDVSRGYVSYVQTDYSELVDEFSFQVSNGYTTLTNLTLSIDIAPSVVPLDVHNLTVLEGRSKAITADVIRVGHVLYENLDFMVHILQSPSHGIIETTRQSGVNLESFTTQDIENEFIYYVHDGSEGISDQFKLAVNNSDKHSNAYTIFITVEPVNDQPPSVVANNGLVAIMGAHTPLTNASLSAVDPDTDDDNITFTITSPGNGFLSHADNPNVPVLSFTQADLTLGNIIFVHTGSRTGGFRFQVTDGVHTTQQQIFTIRASPLLLSVANNNQLVVNPGTIEPITVEYLQVVTNEEPVSDLSRPITFVVMNQPSSGELVKIVSRDISSGTVSFVSTVKFTQDDINQGKIAYKHDNSSNSAEDTFRFDVFLPLSQNLSELVFQLSIPVESNPIISTTVVMETTTALVTTAPPDDSGIINTGIDIVEGGMGSITPANLSAEILLSGLSGYLLYEVTQTPMHGFLSQSGRNLTKSDTFTQRELAMQGLQYTHDHSDTLHDSFNFSAMVKLFGGAAAELDGLLPFVDGVFQVRVAPINDQKFTILTSSLRMTIVQGETVMLNTEYLNIVDPDNLPSEISYNLLSQPSNGKLVNLDDPGAKVKKFTQAQVNDNRLKFIHNGGSVSGSFLFRVNDGKHFQIKQFYVDVVPLIFQIPPTIPPLILFQGDTVTIITDSHLNITGNGNISSVRYNVTTKPNFGELRIGSEVVQSFTQHHIQQGYLEYHQTNLSSSSDVFTLTLYDAYNTIPDVNLTVEVEPIIVLSDIAASSGGSTPLTQSNFNATELANKTNSTPTFSIIRPPFSGRIQNASSGEAVFHFTFHDLAAEMITYRADNLEVDENDTLTDNFTFVFSADNAQPVTLSIGVVIGPMIPTTTQLYTTTTESNVIPPVEPVDSNITNNINPVRDDVVTIAVASSTVGDAGPDAKAVGGSSPSIIYIAVSIVLVLILLIVILVVVIWRRKHRKKVQEPVSQDDYPETFTAAPASIPSQTSDLHSTATQPATDFEFESSAVTQPIINRPVQSPLVPQVKVTPLGRPPSPKNSYASLTSNGTIGSSTFSYNWGSVDPELLDHLQATSPTLKRSQYWV